MSNLYIGLGRFGIEEVKAVFSLLERLLILV